MADQPVNSGRQFYPAASTQAYLAQIPQQVQQRANDYTHGGHWLLLFSALAGVLINLLIIRLGLLERLSQRWERARSRPWTVSLLVFAAYFLLAWLLDLPWALYSKWWREVQYGLSHQGAGAWLAESLISACFSAVLLGVAVMLLYALMRRSPQRWWLWSSAMTAGVILVVTLLSPVLIEPAFNDFKPLAAGKQRDAVSALAGEAGIAASQIVSYDGSKQSSNYTAHVSGLFGTARIAISDALLSQASEAELRAVVGHEIGHYVLHHELWLALGYAALLTLGFWVVHILYGPLARKLGVHQALTDPAGFPVLSIILTVSFLLLTPVTNGMVRLVENQADAYSLAHAREPDGMALALLRTADYRAPEPGWLEEWLFYDHPSIARRIQRAIVWKTAGIKSAGIDHVGINVPDLQQAEEFLHATFGCEAVTHIGPFPMAPRADSVTLAMLRCGNGANIELFEYKNPAGSSAMPKSEDVGASHIAFYTDDVGAGVAYLKSKGITLLGEPVTVTSGDTAGETWVHFRSPWGSEMELVGYPQGKGYEKKSPLRLWNPKFPAR